MGATLAYTEAARRATRGTEVAERAAFACFATARGGQLVRDAEPNSHAKEWRKFTDAVITKLNDRRRPVVFVLWGQPAQSKRDLIDENRHEVITAPHPAARGLFQTQFRAAGTFAEVNRRLKALDVAPVDWGIA